MIEAGAPVGVVGAGTMGAGIAEVAARAGHPVRIVDADQGAVPRALDALRARLSRDVERGRLPAAEASAVADRVRGARSVADLAGCALVIEAVAEDLAVKRALLAELDGVVAAGAVLATNTSSLSVTAVAAGSARPGRVVGLHFFNPAPRMRLVEVVHGDATDPAVAESAAELARSWGKTPVHCTSTPGFVVNRVARPFYGEAQRIVEEGVADPATVDAVLREAGGFPMGPFELTDLVGQDVNLAVSRSVWEQTFGDPRYAPTVLQQRLVDAGRLGRKTGRGVFDYRAGRPTAAQPLTEPRRAAPSHVDVVGLDEGAFGHLTPFVERIESAGVQLRRRALPEDPAEVGDDGAPWVPGVVLPGGAVLRVTSGEPATASWGGRHGGVLLDWAHDPAACTRVALMASVGCPPESLEAAVGLCQAAGVAVSVIGDAPGGIVARTVSMLVNEAVELVARGEASARDVDTAMLLGTSYPSGPVEWGDRVGPALVSEVVESLHAAVPSGRYRVSPLLARAAAAEVLLRDL